MRHNGRLLHISNHSLLLKRICIADQVVLGPLCPHEAQTERQVGSKSNQVAKGVGGFRCALRVEAHWYARRVISFYIDEKSSDKENVPDDRSTDDSGEAVRILRRQKYSIKLVPGESTYDTIRATELQISLVCLPESVVGVVVAKVKRLVEYSHVTTGGCPQFARILLGEVAEVLEVVDLLWVVGQGLDVSIEVDREISIEDDFLVNTVVDSEVGGNNGCTKTDDGSNGGVEGGK